MTELRQRLLALGEAPYADFQARLTPGVLRENCLGVRQPALRAFARSFSREPGCEAFLEALPHRYLDENMLHSILLSMEKDYERCIDRVERFLPCIDNWAVCDTLRPKVFAKHRPELLPVVERRIASPEVYTCRFGLNMLMTHWLDEDFRPEYLELAVAVNGEDYYVRMMVAWYMATALAKQWEATLPIIAEHRLPRWTHLKSIQKACESFRVPEAHKAILKGYRREVEL